MNAPDPIEQLRARLARLALDPRVKLLPDGPAIMRELLALIELVAMLGGRVTAIEHALQLTRSPNCDDD